MADFEQIIDIKINDESFKEFKSLFDKYMKDLQAQGGVWKDANSAMARTQAVMHAMADKAAEVNSSIGDAAKSQHKFSQETDKTGGGMHKLANSTKNVAGHIMSATKSLLKWAGITSALGGFLGLGGLFGIDRLAASAGAQQKSAAGFGTTVGQDQAFKIRFGNMLSDPGSFQSAINTAQSDPARQAMFMALGIPNASSMTPGALNIRTMQALRDLWMRHPGNRNPNYMRALGIDNIVSLQDWRRIGTAPDFAYEMSRYQRDARALNVSPSTGIGWQHFTQGIDVSEGRLGNVFKNALLRLAGPINQLVNAIVNATQKLMNSPLMKGAIDSLATGIQRFAGYINSPDFQDDMENFLDALHSMARTMGKLFGFIDPTRGEIIRDAAHGDPKVRQALLDIRHMVRSGGASGGVGWLNVNPAAAAQIVGHLDMHNRAKQGEAAGYLIRNYLLMSKGNVQQAEELYMSGVRPDLPSIKGRFPGYVPGDPRSTPVNIVIQNNTGGSASAIVRGVGVGNQ